MKDTFLRHLFPSIERKPLKDGFHAINGATRLLHDGSPEGKSEFSNDIAEAIRPHHQPDLSEAAAWVLKRPAREGSEVATDQFQAIAIAKKSHKEHIRREGPPGPIIAANLTRVMKKWGDRHETAKANGQKCCIRSKTDELDGTIEYMGEKMLPCANKECYSHPLTVDQMCVPPLVSHLPHLTPHIPTSHTPYSNSSGTTASARSRSPS